jgi:hypothetical protein
MPTHAPQERFYGTANEIPDYFGWESLNCMTLYARAILPLLDDDIQTTVRDCLLPYIPAQWREDFLNEFSYVAWNCDNDGNPLEIWGITNHNLRSSMKLVYHHNPRRQTYYYDPIPHFIIKWNGELARIYTRRGHRLQSCKFVKSTTAPETLVLTAERYLRRCPRLEPIKALRSASTSEYRSRSHSQIRAIGYSWRMFHGKRLPDAKASRLHFLRRKYGKNYCT